MTKFLPLLVLLPQLLFGLIASPKAAGRGWAVIAQPQDTLSGAFNPAGLAFLGNRWDLGVLYTHSKGDVTVSDNEFQNGTFNAHRNPDYFIPEFGISADVCECYMTLGLIGYNRNFVKTTFKDPIDIYGTSKVGIDYIEETLSPILTIRFGGCHALGLSCDFIFQRLKVDGLQNFQALSEKPGRVTNQKYDTNYGITGTIGWTSIFDNWIFVGLAYQPEMKATRFGRYKGLLPNKGELSIPQRMMGGIAVRPIPCVTVEFDVEYVKWNDVRTFNNRLEPSIDNIPAFATKDGVGLGWRNQAHFRFGAEYMPIEHLILRVGYTQARTPIKPSQAYLGALTAYVVEQYATGGLSYTFNSCTELSIFFAWGFENSITGRDSIPDQFGGGDIQIKDQNYLTGLSIGRKF